MYSGVSIYQIYSKNWAQALPSITMFFNFFVAAEPYASVKVTHGTPCALIRESSDVRKDEAIECLRTHFPSKALKAEAS